MNETTIKRLLLARVFALRRNQFAYDSLDRPQSAVTDTIQTPNGPRLRRRIVLTAHGCSVATCTMCPLPDEAVSSKTEVTLDHWMAQLRAGMAGCDDIHTLTLFHNGNFFADREVPDTWRLAIYHYLRTTGIKELVVESLPQYLSAETLFIARLGLRGIKLTVAIGLQSSSALVRELCITSTCLEGTFAKAVAYLHAQGDAAQAFLMFHPPFLTIEESMWDLRESIRYVQTCGVTPTICPMRIAPHTVVADLADKGLYQAPNLWYLYDALEGIENVRVAASLLDEEHPQILRDAFAELNQTGKPPDLGCWSMRPQGGRVPVAPERAAVLGRIEAYLQHCT
jgi:radical SAM enzyme (TIGR01210 family)